MIEFAAQTEHMIIELSFLYVITLDHNGHKDWRLPTRKEHADNNFTLGWTYDGDNDPAWQPGPWSEIHESIVTPVRDL